MDRFGGRSNLEADSHQQQSLSEGNSHLHHEIAAGQSSEFRQFTLQPIVGPSRQGFGCEALFRAGWEDTFSDDPNVTSRIMLDNCLLYGLDEPTTGRSTFLRCTRETLMSGFHSLMPRSAVFAIQESLKPDNEVLSICRTLKAAGYRFALDDFASPEAMEGFLDLADFIKVDFQHSRRRGRACMLRRLNLTGATLIADKIESDEEFHEAMEEGFGLFQGNYFAERISFAKKGDALDVTHCTRILKALQEPGLVAEGLIELINLESGIECRLIRRANWATPPSVVVDSIRDALEVLGRADIQNVMYLALKVASERAMKPRSEPDQWIFEKLRESNLLRWLDAGALTPQLWSADRGSILWE